MGNVLQQLQDSGFWVALGVVLPVVSGLLSQVTRLVESGEIKASQAQRRSLEMTARWVAMALRFANQGPGSWRNLLLAAGATGAALLNGCGTTAQAAPTTEMLYTGAEAWCSAEAERLPQQYLDPEALVHAQEDHALFCDVMLTLIETRGDGFLPGDPE